ncbi:MAG: cyclic nucleotide-binding domain-containing protein [Holophagales bacterium]|nr:cyclic nucleotide-binding domain-containing protein [Holophagales bacterium]
MTLFESRTSGDARLKEVVDECRRRLRDDPADTGAVLRLADALASGGDPREAVQVLNRAGPRLQKAGRLVEAIAVYKKVEELDPKAEVTSSFLSQIELKKLLEATAKAQAKVQAQALAAAPPAPGPASPPSAGVAERRKKSERVHALRKEIPLLKDIPPFLFELVLEKIHLRTLAPGQTLFAEGDDGSSLSFVAAGELVVSAKGDDGALVLLGLLGPGDVAGEISFLSGVPRTATVSARTRVDLLELDRNALTPLVKKHRHVADALSRLYAERVLDGVLARSRLFGRLPRTDRDALARRLKPVAAKPGEVLIREGASDAGLYLVRRGAVRVTVKRGARDVALALLTPHDFFGDLATVRSRPRTASVTAVTDTELLWLAGADLLALLAQRPELTAVLEEIQLERFVRNAETLASAD